MEVVPNDGREAALLALGEYRHRQLKVGQAQAPGDKGWHEPRPHGAERRQVAAGPEEVLRPEETQGHGALEGFGAQDQGGRVQLEHGRQVLLLGWQEHIGNGENRARPTVGQGWQRGKGGLHLVVRRKRVRAEGTGGLHCTEG